MEAVAVAYEHYEQIRRDTGRVVENAIGSGFALDERLTVSAWADKHRYLSTTASAEAGPWRTSRVPYAREIMNVLSTRHPAQRVVFMKPSQIAGTEIGLNWCGYVIHKAPGPMIMVLPDERMAERNSKTRIQPMIDACDPLRQRIRPPRQRDSGNTVLTKEFPGGFLAMVSARSPNNLRMLPCRYAYMDEIDGYPIDAGGEGDPIELVITRTRTFAKRKVFMTSSPTIRGTSRIEKEFENSDKRRYYVPCPSCQHFQTLRFENLKYVSGEPDSVYYSCENCRYKIKNHHKTWMLQRGEWRAENPGAEAVGFHLNALYSPVGWLSWAEVVSMWELAQRDVTKLKTFINTILAETWHEKGEAPAWESLYRRREQYKIGTVPAGGLFLTAGADVQKDRIEVETVAWGRDMQSWSVDYTVIPGDTSSSAVWRQLDNYLDQSFPHERGLSLKIMRMGVDSGFNTQFVYQYARQYAHTARVIATKGMDALQSALGHPKAVDLDLNGKVIKRALKMWPVGVSMLKVELYRYLAQQPPLKDGEPFPRGYCHFPEYDEEYFRMLTGEQMKRKENRRGFTTHEWVKVYERNEALDCRIIARAAAASLGYDRITEKQLRALENQLNIDTEPTASQAETAPATAAAPRAKARVRRVRSRGL